MLPGDVSARHLVCGWFSVTKSLNPKPLFPRRMLHKRNSIPCSRDGSRSSVCPLEPRTSGMVGFHLGWGLALRGALALPLKHGSRKNYSLSPNPCLVGSLSNGSEDIARPRRSLGTSVAHLIERSSHAKERNKNAEQARSQVTAKTPRLSLE